MIRKILVIYLLFLVFFSWGFAAMRYQVFPGGLLNRLGAYLEQPQEQKQKPAIASTPATTQKSDPLKHQSRKFTVDSDRHYQAFAPDLFADRVNTPLLWRDPAAQTGGYRLLWGTFAIGDTLQSTLLLDDRDHIVHQWSLDDSVWEEFAEGAFNNADRRDPTRRLPHGIEVFADGSVVLTDDTRGTGLFRIDRCSDLVWARPGRFNDSITMDSSSRQLWAISDESLVRIDADSGEETKRITLNDIHLANPDVAVLTPRRSLRSNKWYHDPTHVNDVEALPEALAGHFPMFEAGDLLVSMRSLNLLLVIDPETAVIKWWRTGISRRQYDIDWESNGHISIYDNNRRENREQWDGKLLDAGTRYSRVIEIDPVSRQTTVIFDGSTENFYNARHGKHQALPDGNLLISSPEQGRFIEVTRDGRVVHELVNRIEESKVLVVSEARWLPGDFFEGPFPGSSDCR